MIELSTSARVNADNTLRKKIRFVFESEEPFVIKMKIRNGSEEITWDIGRVELRDAVLGNWPSGIADVIIIKYEGTLRIYLRNEVVKTSLDFKLSEIKSFLEKTYEVVSHWDEQVIIERDIDKWTSS